MMSDGVRSPVVTENTSCAFDAIALPSIPRWEKDHHETLPPPARDPACAPPTRADRAQEPLSLSRRQRASAVPALRQWGWPQSANDFDECERIRASRRLWNGSAKLRRCCCHRDLLWLWP